MIFFTGDIPTSGQVFFWFQYFPYQVSDGYAVYKDTKKHYESQNVIFQRLFPRSEESKKYPMDELNVDAMINTIEKEKKTDPNYFQEVLFAAVVIALRIIQDHYDEFSNLASQLIEWSLHKNKPETGFYISKSLEKLLRKKPDFNYVMALYWLGLCYFDLEKFLEAKKELLKCLDMINKDQSIPSKSKDLKSKVMDLLGRCYYDLGVFDESENALKEALKLKPKIPKFPKSMLLTLINLSKTQIELNKFNEALEHANLALTSNEPTDEALINRGKCYMFAENFPKAIEDFQRVDISQANKIHQSALKSYLGFCNLSLGKIEPALLLHANALDIYKEIHEEEHDPNIIKVELMAGQAFIASANYYNALHRLEKGQKYAQEMFHPLKEHPLIAESLLHLGSMMIEVGDYASAKRLLFFMI